MRDLLIRYLLGELDDEAQQRLEQGLRERPELRRELSYLQACFLPSAGAEQQTAAEPPPGLAERTTEQVTSLSSAGSESPGPEREPAPTWSSAASPPSDSSSASVSWSLADLSVAAGVFLAVSMLLLPALRGSRDYTRLNTCADILHQYGFSISRYVDVHHSPPQVEANELAAVFVARLVEDGLADRQQVQGMLLCPGSQRADEVSAKRCNLEIPPPVELRIDLQSEISIEEWNRFLRTLNWDYAVPIGWTEGAQYRSCRDREQNVKRSCRRAWMADAPTPVFDAAGPRSANHNGRCLNILMAGCNVQRVRCCKLHEMVDHPFLNDAGEPMPGCQPEDNVLIPPNRTPLVLTLDRAR